VVLALHVWNVTCSEPRVGTNSFSGVSGVLGRFSVVGLPLGCPNQKFKHGSLTNFWRRLPPLFTFGQQQKRTGFTFSLTCFAITEQVALVICGLFICDFAYMQFRNDFFSGTYPLIISHPWSFYMWILYMRVYFWSPYPSHITRSNCIRIHICVSLIKLEKETFLRYVIVITKDSI